MRTRSATTARKDTTVTRVGFAPIVRVDPDRREIELCATSEALDAHGTVFAYAASRDAFARWAGNVREMHERKAVGRRVAVRCDDDARKVYVRVRVSRGAEDTWQKVLDGTLRGASIGATNITWRRERAADGQQTPVATRYDLVELSLVDLPSNPDALGVTFVRDGVPLAELLDEIEESDEEELTHLGVKRPRLMDVPLVEPLDAGESGIVRVVGSTERLIGGAPGEESDPAAATTLARGKAAIAAVASDAAHASQPRRTQSDDAHERTPEDPAHQAKRARLALLGAPGYAPGYAAASQNIAGADERARGPFSNNPDGPPHMGVPARAEERPTSLDTGAHAHAHDQAPYQAHDHQPDGDREAAFHAAARNLLRACGCPACHAALAALDGTEDGDDDGHAPDGNRLATARLTRALDAHTRRLDASIQAIRAVHDGVGQLGALLGTIERRVAAIEEQPMPGGPVLRVAEKTHALLPGGGQGGAGEQLRALETLAGRLRDPQAQIAVATEMIRLQQGAAGLTPDPQAMPRAGSGGY